MSTQENDASAVPVKIERLRNKLLDLSYRNPLLSTRLDSARNSYIRVVDELPDFLFSHLHQEGGFTFKPLPPLPLEENPQDEEGEEFQERLAEAHINDPEYISEIEEIDPSDKNAFAREQDAERSLRDRIRAELGMSRRKTVDHPLAEHAREHGISPGYDLPSQNEKAEHGDDFIQTLLLPDNLERTAGRLIRKNREWQNETGINVMHTAFDFLEWRDPARDKNTLSPLVLLPVRIEEKRTERGIEFRAKGIEESSEANSALAEKLRRDFGIELPRYESNHSIEDYMDSVARMSVSSIVHWRVRRYIAFGVFPSAGLVMYNDLDTAKGSFSGEIVNRVLGENQDVKTALFQAEDYDIDNPSVESRVSILLDRADSSQFSTMVEVANNKDLAVEGPPGTGKSQTIVNVIGAALADGKKVLFVAEKMAALEVVQSRLKHLGMEEFTLPLQPKRSSLRQVLESIKKRIAARAQDSDEDYEKKRLEFKKVRDDIAGYISLISREYGNTSLTIHEIIGLAIRTQELSDSLPRDITNLELDFPVDRDRIRRICDIAERLEEDWKNVKDTPSVWSGLNVSTRDKFTLDDIRSRIAEVSVLYGEMDTLGERLSELGLRGEADESAPLPANQLRALGEIGPTVEFYSLARDAQEMGTLKEFLASQRKLDQLRSHMKTLLREPSGELLTARLCKIRETIREAGGERGGRSPTLGELRKNQEALLGEQEERKRDIAALAEKVPSVRKWRVKTLMSTVRILGETNEAVLSLRNSAATDPKERLLIEKDLKTGSELLGEREQLGEFFHAEKVSDAEEIAELAATLKSGGFFSFLSSKYRTAKRRYITLSKETGFNKEQAVEKTVRLAQWASGKKKFLETQRLEAAFGEYFRGADTDFETLGKLLNYYERVEKEIGYSANREARDFLFKSPTDLLRFVEAEKPEWLTDIRDGEMTLDEIAEETGRRVATLERRNETIERFGEMSSHFTGGDIWSLVPDDLCRLADLAEKYAALEKSVEENPLREAFEQRLADAENRTETIEKNLDIADILLGDPRWTEALLEIMLRGELGEAEKCVGEFLGKSGGAAAAVQSLKEKTGIEIEGPPGEMDYSQVAEYLSAVAQDEEGIAKRANYSATRQEMENEGAGRWVGKLLESDTGLFNLSQTLEALIGRALLMKVNREHPEILRDYSGKRLDVLREELVEADKSLLEVSRLHLRSKLITEAKPPEGNGKGKVSTHTELSLINHEINKKRRHVPLRDLIRRARGALLELKPCWMMSPLAVAQYLERDGEKFDLCIIDEASQMTPENAIGALSRTKQVMVVGDTNQLPPSNFFRKMISDDDIDEDEDVPEESILEMANQAFAKSQLRWHYRSRDDRLIRYSNHTIYDNNLIIFPSPNQGTENRRTGVSLVKIEGTYKSGLNRAEAKTVIEETLRFMAEQPHRSLAGVYRLHA